jgi:iron complex outermembrane recepter protein
MCSASLVHGQIEVQSDTVNLLDLSFEDLMSVRIVSASKKDESLFEAPVTSFVISKSEIVNSGATSIPDALRLAPGLIVREVANGSYDVSIRGGKDNLPSHQFWNLNNTILAMIDNRVIFNYYEGGTYWQSLPVDLADVERIEIVYGPNSPLYGPNAVDGVINIITRKGNGGTETYGSASVQAGKDLLFSALGGKQITDNLGVTVSVNHVNRKRIKTEYYDVATHTFITDLRQHSDPAIAADPNAFYPNPGLASRHTGLNFNLHFKPAKNTVLTYNSSYNESLGLTATTFGSIFQHQSSTSYSNMIKAEVGNLTFQASVLQGRIGTKGNLTQFDYDYLTWDNYLDYNLKITPKLSFRPSISYQKATMDDEAYTVKVGRKGLFNNKATMDNYAFSLKADYSPIKALRFIGAVRADKFKAPNDLYVSYQGIVNYKFGNIGVLRFLSGRSFSGSFIEETYLNFPVVDDAFMKMTVFGNENRNLLQNDILEVGYKTQLGKNVGFDITIFQQSYSNFTAPITTIVKDPSFDPPQPGEWEVNFENIDLKSRQNGVTVSATLLFGKIKFKPFLTVQKTQLFNYSPFYNAPHPIFAPENNIEKTSNIESEYAPNAFGGFSLNIPVRKWNFNFSGYSYNKYKQNGLNNFDFVQGLVPTDLDTIHSKFLLNANVTYNVSSKFKTFFNARNILAQDAREAYGTDRIGTMLFTGINIEF